VRPAARLAAAADGTAAAVLVALLLVIALLQVADRYAVHSGYGAYDSLARLCLVWLCFAGLPGLYARGRGVRVELFTRLPARVARLREAAFEAVALAVTILVHKESWRVLEVASYQQIVGTPFTYAHSVAALTLGTALLVPVQAWRIRRALAATEPAAR
jgi:TRAP-type C4-dicarboxylate transport system permease small subunit